jgi:hypothetical protein
MMVHTATFSVALSKVGKKHFASTHVKCRFNERRSNEIFSKTNFFSGPPPIYYISQCTNVSL